MKYRVIVTHDAEDDLRQTCLCPNAGGPSAARAWLAGIRKKITTLSEHPLRAHLAPEAASFSEGGGREIFHGASNRGTYRILFVVIAKFVFGLHIRHGSMLALDPDE